jgi:hypothetical protein
MILWNFQKKNFVDEMRGVFWNFKIFYILLIFELKFRQIEFGNFEKLNSLKK